MNTADTATIRRYASDPMAFIGDLTIVGPDGPAKFGDVMADFQREAFEALTPCLLAVAAGTKPKYRGLWLERTKGASKDSDCAIALLWALLFCPRPILVEIGADDQGQSLEMMKAMLATVRLNRWVEQRLEFQRFKILCPSTGSVAEFLTSDSTGAHGSRPTISIVNELSHISNENFALTMLDNATKVSNNLMIIATNAGFLGSWQYKWREKQRANERWYFQAVDHPAPWVNPADVSEAAARNTISRQKRLWHGVWSGEGDALSPADVEACCIHKEPMKEWIPGWAFASGTDLGTKRDRAALVVLGCEIGSGKVRLASCQSWAPDPKTGQVDLQAVRQAHLEAFGKFGLCWSGFDPYQASLMAQDLSNHGLTMVEVPFTATNLIEMAQAILAGFRERKIELYRDEELLSDLLRLSIVERRYGYRLEATSDERGHCDKATALAIALPFALDAAGQMPPEDDGEDDNADWYVVP